MVKNNGGGALTWSAAPVTPDGTGVSLNHSPNTGGLLSAGMSTMVTVSGTPSASPFDITFTSVEDGLQTVT